MSEQALRAPYSRSKRRLGNDEQATWRAFIRAHATVTRRLEHELVDAGGLTLSDLDVLATLEREPSRELRLSELADRVLLTKSGVTRLVDRLESEGYLTRRVCPSDRRGQLAAVTAPGRRALRRAMATHVRGIAAAFADHVRGDERSVLLAVLERIAAQPSGH